MQTDGLDSASVQTVSPKLELTFRRKLIYGTIIYLIFLLILLAVELITRATLPHVSSLELFVSTPQQRCRLRMQKQKSIFEGDPLLLWRLKPNLEERCLGLHCPFDKCRGRPCRLSYSRKSLPAHFVLFVLAIQ